MDKRHFNSQRDAMKYYGHSWKWLYQHYYVTTTFNSLGMKTGYFIKKS